MLGSDCIHLGGKNFKSQDVAMTIRSKPCSLFIVDHTGDDMKEGRRRPATLTLFYNPPLKATPGVHKCMSFGHKVNIYHQSPFNFFPRQQGQRSYKKILLTVLKLFLSVTYFLRLLCLQL